MVINGHTNPIKLEHIPNTKLGAPPSQIFLAPYKINHSGFKHGTREYKMIKKFLKYVKEQNDKENLPRHRTISGIDVEITKKNIGNLHLRVRPPNGTVHISTPSFVSDQTIRSFVLSKTAWLKNQIENYQNQIPQLKIEYISSEVHYLWGRAYHLEVLETNSSVVSIKDTSILLTICPTATSTQREKVLNVWYQEQLELALPPLFEKWEGIMGVHADEVKIKRMHSRWSKRNTKSKQIWLNLNLAKEKPQCLEYVIVIELAHLFKKLHNKRFKFIMDKFLPDWRAYRAVLNKEGEVSIAAKVMEALKS